MLFGIFGSEQKRIFDVLVQSKGVILMQIEWETVIFIAICSFCQSQKCFYFHMDTFSHTTIKHTCICMLIFHQVWMCDTYAHTYTSKVRCTHSDGMNIAKSSQFYSYSTTDVIS